ncbi:MAG TPA: hypothetical protein VIH35_10195, partial [Kiritimatiellia bacterium]
PALAAGTEVRYKIAAFKRNADSVFPWTDTDIDVRLRMETLFEITNFNAATIPFYPHNDWGLLDTGLDEGFHALRTKAFLGRAPGDTPIYRERTQTFYYDTKRPEGLIKYPPADGLVLTGTTYGVRVRTDMTVEEVWYKIEDLDAANDDGVTGVGNGNNAWVKAVRGVVTAPAPGGTLEQQWEFNYVLIPTSGTATIKARLREVSSSTNQSLADVDGHFTTLLRTVDTGGNGVRLYVSTPSSDGAVVGVGSNFIAQFTKSLANGLSDPQLVQQFAIDLDGATQSNSAYVIQRDVTTNEHSIRLSLPNLYNGDPNALHQLMVTFTRTGYPTLVAQRQVFAAQNDDSNGDGIPDAWEHQWDIPAGTLWGTNDDDADGFNNYAEYVADTHPYGSNAYLVVNSMACTGNVSSLCFPTSSNRNYFVWYSDSLVADSWHLATPLTDPIEGTGQTNQFNDAFPNATGRFYRLEVKVPSP